MKGSILLVKHAKNVAYGNWDEPRWMSPTDECELKGVELHLSAQCFVNNFQGLREKANELRAS